MSKKIADAQPCFYFPVIKTFAINIFWLNFYRIAYIDKLIVFRSLYCLLFPAALEQNLAVSQESLLIFYIPNESISELKVVTKCNAYYFYNSRLNNYSGKKEIG